MNSDLYNKVEALLFALGPMTHEELAGFFKVSVEEVSALASAGAERGVVMVNDGRTLELRAGGNAAAIVEQVRKEELSRDIGRAGVEALAAILYRGPLTRSEIDFIRGVNSTQTLRTLTMRGLIRKVENPKDVRSYLYEPTTELLAHLGVNTPSDLPEFEAVRAKLASLEANYRKDE